MKIFTKKTKINFLKLKIRNFCDKLKPEENLTKLNKTGTSKEVIKKIMKEQDNIHINNGVFKIKDPPVYNHFGEHVLYYSNSELPNKYLRSYIEISGVVTISTVTFLNYFGLIFPSVYIFNYLLVLTLFSNIKIILRSIYKMSIIYQMTLVNENFVRITYIQGTVEDVLIKDVHLTSKTRSDLILEGKEPLNSFIPIEVRVNGKQNALINLSTYKSIHRDFVDLFNLLGVLNKNTKRLIF